MKKIFISAVLLLLGSALWAQANLTITSAAQVVVDSNWVLTVEGPIANQGALIIESGSSLIQTHSGADANINSGEYDVRRIGSNSPSEYNIWSSPVQDDSITDGPGAVFNGANPCDIYTFNGSTQKWKYDFPVGFSTTCLGNPVTFTSAHVLTDVSPDNKLDPMRGYFVPGDTNFPKRRFVGDINNGEISTPIYYTTITTTQWSGTNWNLVGNPYPSAIDLQTFWTLNAGTGNITDGIYFWNSAASPAYDQCADYIVWNPVGVASSCGASSTQATLGVVSSGQGFWVYANGTGTGTKTLTFNNSLRTTAQNSNFYKKSPAFERVWLSVQRNGRATNQILLGLKDDATVGYDPMYDARKLPESSSFELAFVQDSGIYLILAQPTISYNEQEELPLYLRTDSAGIHTFAFDSTQNVSSGNKYYLIDKSLNITHDLSTPYQVQLPAGTYQNRFYLLYRDVVNDVNSSVAVSNTVKVFQSGSEIVVQSGKKRLKEVTVYNAVGQIITRKNSINERQISISSQQLAAGVYMVNYTLSDETTKTEKIILAH